MANKRMFTMSIVDSDAFLDMPLSTQCLYFHLNMRADDDGFIGNPKRIQRLIGASDDDLKLLVAKRFVLAFDDGVIVIKHWRMHNTIRKDRYTSTAYQDELSVLLIKDNNSYSLTDGNQLATNWQPNVIPDGTTGIGLGLDIGLDLDKEVEKEKINYQLIADLYNNTCVSFPSLTRLSDKRKKAIKARLNVYSIEELQKAFEKAEASDFLKGSNTRNWSATFDWIMNDTNIAKILDGNYDNKKQQPQKKKDNKFNNFTQRQYTSEQFREMEKALLNRQEEQK